MRLGIGWVRAKTGDPLTGIKHVKDALALRAGARSYRILGRIYVQLGRLDDADDAYSAGVGPTTHLTPDRATRTGVGPAPNLALLPGNSTEVPQRS